MTLSYRGEIDGLRAVAVIPVILFHAGLEGVGGGYVGVDVFFVISGYLITSILLSEIRSGSFSIVTFYERRARRLLPALFFVIACCLPFAWSWMTPDQLRDFGRSIVAVTLFSSNVLFWLESGYFTSTAEVKPLLHTWSLSVEEQFYVVFPLVLLTFRRLRNSHLLWIFMVLALASFALAQLGGNLQYILRGEQRFSWMAVPDYAFYLAPTRAWELLIGAMIALYLLQQEGHRAPSSNTLSFLGLALIGCAIIRFDSDTPFPSVYTLVPVIGTALVILFTSANTTAGRLLSTPILVGMGLLSYSAYLWHQPLFAFARLRSVTEPSTAVFLILAAASIGLAFLTWRYVERPFRDRRRFDRGHVFGFSAATMVVMLAVGLAGHMANGFESRFGIQISKLRVPEQRVDSCTNAQVFLNADHELPCTVGAAGVRPKVAIVGDSHAASLTTAFREAGAEAGFSILPINDNWCAPLYLFGTAEPSRNPSCRRLMQHALETIAASDDLTTVVLVAEWANYTTGTRWQFNRPAVYSDPESTTFTADRNPETFRRSVVRTLDLLRDKHVIVVKSVPEYQTRVPETLAKAVLFNGGELPDELKVNRVGYRARNAEVDQVWADVSGRSIDFVDSDRVFCPQPDDWCRYEGPDGVWYQDDNHLSYLGAKRIIAPVLDLMQPSEPWARIGSI